jgi:hypothetical protein
LDAAAVSRIAPWAGWIGGLLGWLLAHRAGSDLVQWDCTATPQSVLLSIGIGGGVMALAGAFVSLTVWRGLAGKLDQPYAGTRRFIAATGGLAAGIFALAILFQTISAFIIPQCVA